MGLDQYLRGMVHRWHIIALFILLGLVGTWGYFQWSGGATWGNFRWSGASSAVATVSVMEPTVTRSMTGQQAFVSFASIAESRTVAERVVRKLGLDLSAGDLQGKVSVKLSRTLVPSVPTPLYMVEVENPSAELATRLANAVVEEARLLFIEMNTTSQGQVDAAVLDLEARMRGEAQSARTALRDFEEANGAWRLDAQIASKMAVVDSLRQATLIAQANETTRRELLSELESAQAELARLRSLKPAYESLALELSIAATAAGQAAGRAADLTISGSPSVLASAQANAEAARQRLEQTRRAITEFQVDNRLMDLPSELQNQAGLVMNLRESADPARNSAFEATRAELQGRLSDAEARLAQLTSLQPEFDRLSLNVLLATNAVRQFSDYGNGMELMDHAAGLEGARAREEDAKRRLVEVQSELTRFRETNGLSDLTAEMASQAATVAELRRSTLLSAIGQSSAAEDLISEQLEAAETRLASLRGLQPEFDSLSLDVAIATTAFAQASARANELALLNDGAMLELAREQEASARQRFESARGRLTAYQRANGITDVSSELGIQSALVNDLRRAVLNGGTRPEALGEVLAPEQAELRRLYSLISDRDQLVSRLAQAEAKLGQLETRKVDLVLQGSMAPQGLVKVLDPAEPRSNLLWTIILYVLGAVFGAFAGLVVVYLLTYFDRSPRTAAEVHELVGAPVLIRVPSAY